RALHHRRGNQDGRDAPPSPMANSVGLRHHLPGLGLDISSDPCGRAGGTAILASRHAILRGRNSDLFVDAREGLAFATRREWASASLLAVLIFVGDYGLLFWAEKRV